MGSAAIPQGRVFFPVYTGRTAHVDKDSREALQVAKELTAKFIETRTVSPGNFAEIFPAVYGVVARAIVQFGNLSSAGEAPDARPGPEAGAGTLRRQSRASAGDRE